MDSARASAERQGTQKKKAGKPERARRRTQLAAPIAVPIAQRGVALPGGSNLPADVLAQMQRAFGVSFADVRVHTDERAAQETARRGARAVTQGKDVLFAPGAYAPNTHEGRELLAHELAHVVQQQGAAGAAPAGHAALEHDAQRAARAAMSDAQADVGLAAAPGAAQCAPEEEGEIKKIPDPAAGKIRVVRVRKDGTIIQGLAEITPSDGNTKQAERVDVDRKADGHYEVAIPEEWQGTHNPAANVRVEKSQQMEFLEDDLIVSDNPEDKYNTDPEVRRYLWDTQPSIAIYFEQDTPGNRLSLDAVRQTPEFKAWRKHQVVKAQRAAFKQQTERENEYYRRLLDPTGEMGITGEQAREIAEDAHGPADATDWERQRQQAGTMPTPIRDAATGVIVGYVTYAYREVRLGGGVGEVSTIVLDRDGNEVHRDNETVLTPGAAFIQDTLRSAPVTGNLINAAEVGGLSLDIRDPGRFLSEAERGDRLINAVPFADTARSAVEVGTGVDLSDRGIQAQLNGDVLLLPSNVRKGKGILLGVEAVTALVGLRAKFKPKVRAKVPHIEPPKARAMPKPHAKVTAAKAPTVHAPPVKVPRARAKPPVPVRDNPALSNAPAVNDNVGDMARRRPKRAQPPKNNKVTPIERGRDYRAQKLEQQQVQQQAPPAQAELKSTGTDDVVASAGGSHKPSVKAAPGGGYSQAFVGGSGKSAGARGKGASIGKSTKPGPKPQATAKSATRPKPKPLAKMSDTELGRMSKSQRRRLVRREAPNATNIEWTNSAAVKQANRRGKLIIRREPGMLRNDTRRKAAALGDLAQRGKLKTLGKGETPAPRKREPSAFKGTPVPLSTRHREHLINQLHKQAQRQGWSRQRLNAAIRRALRVEGDHVRDLQMGGLDDLDNIWALDAYTNERLGAQIRAQLRNMKPGTVITDVELVP
jgi:hypothetical protein